MAARRCSICLTNWPVHKDYEQCPICPENTTDRVRNSVPLDDDEARILARHAEFERFYEARGPRDCRVTYYESIHAPGIGVGEPGWVDTPGGLGAAVAATA